eukprot:5659283-Amphidinium_carterae.1
MAPALLSGNVDHGWLEGRKRVNQSLSKAIRAVTKFVLDVNWFIGALPEGGIRAFKAVTDMQLDDNAFTGTLPNTGIRTMQAVNFFDVSSNCFTGTLSSGIIRLRNVETFAIADNRFTGMLPGRPLLSRVLDFYIARNGFAGSVRGAA